ncbi:GNAT family N-acetyltransferase [Siphonobacter sp. SORGH_AS_0500]|uniref:GNAT family N-acetyltransferase n=1 Tax=Siphonobacter sp. SORGH_AS_0500 TaxID=1864824 RepID=UPI0028609B1C|nr:GNAT family N-acetyltransferase [Siphonobacter sp. SORGH_AS_0500]MDR6196316.1 ribosomal protein S18 acetylase RimI-like enzyme [Siphonobacter sp. SORGH_AS_0500]
MLLATPQNRREILETLNQAFYTNNHLNWLATGKTQASKRIQPLVAYTFDYGIRHGKVFSTPQQEGVAIWKRYPAKGDFLRDSLLSLQLVSQLGLAPIPRILKTEAYVEKQRSQYPYLYLWMLGVHPQFQGKGFASSLLDPLLLEAQNEEIPVLLETSTLQNVSLYQHKGFEVYHEYQPSRELTIYFLRKDPS